MANLTDSQPEEKVTVVGAKEHAAEHSPDSNKRGGFGSIVAWLTIPGIVLLVLILGYFVLFGLKSNTEEERGAHMRDTPALYTLLPPSQPSAA